MSYSDQDTTEQTCQSPQTSHSLQRPQSDEPPPSPVSAPPDRTLALVAATSRLTLNTAPAPPTLANSAELRRALRQSFFSIIDSEIVERNPNPLALDALQTLLTITSNVLNNPGQEKFKSLKLANPLIQKNIVAAPGAVNYLMACKFAPTVKEHQEFMCFPKSPTPRQLEILALGHETLKERIASRTDASETEERMLKREREAAGAQRARALQNISEDRERQRMRQQREKLARERRAQEPEQIQ